MGSTGSIRSGNLLSPWPAQWADTLFRPQEVAEMIPCCGREGNGPLQTQFRPQTQSPEAQAAEPFIVLLTVMPLPPIWPPGAGATLLAMWASPPHRRPPPPVSCVTLGGQRNLSVPLLLSLRRESVTIFLRDSEE